MHKHERKLAKKKKRAKERSLQREQKQSLKAKPRLRRFMTGGDIYD